MTSEPMRRYSPDFPHRDIKFVLNPFLLARQKIDPGGKIYEALVEPHRAKFDLLDRTARVNKADRWTLRFYADLIDQLEFLQQQLWGLARDPNLHIFWIVPHCQCPEKANEDRWLRIVSGDKNNPQPIYAIDCPIHGTT